MLPPAYSKQPQRVINGEEEGDGESFESQKARKQEKGPKARRGPSSSRNLDDHGGNNEASYRVQKRDTEGRSGQTSEGDDRRDGVRAVMPRVCYQRLASALSPDGESFMV
jgi:hypothetical protein